MAKACARHILVESKEEADRLKKQLAEGADFASLAKNILAVIPQKRGRPG